MKLTAKTVNIPIGPPQHLIERIEHLRSLLKNLPEALPLDPPDHASTYHFNLSPDDLEERGVFGAVSHTLEICFGQRRDGLLHFKERGQRLENLVIMLKAGVKQMSNGDREAFEDAWLNRLIDGAKAAGARIPKRKVPTTSRDNNELPAAKKTQALSPILLDDSDDEITHLDPPQSPIPSSSLLPAIPLASLVSSTASSPSTYPTPTNPSKLKQSFLSFTKDTSTEEEKQVARQKRMERDEKVQAKKLASLAAKKEKADRKRKDRERELARERKRKQRAKQKAEEPESEGDNLSKVLSQGAQEAANSKEVEMQDIATVSRAGFEGWRKGRNGTLGGAKQGKAVRTNWWHPFLWPAIDRAMKKADWSAQDAVKALQHDNPTLYKHLHRGTVWKWKEKDTRAWSEKTREKVKNHHALLGSGRAGALTKHPELVEEIKTTLSSLRISGFVVNVPIARSLMLGLIEQHAPLLITPSFTCSEYFVRDFLQSIMSWSLRVGTRAAAHLPADADDLCMRTFFRLVYLMKWENIPPKLVINGDQQGIFVLPSSSKTYNTKGDSQVDIVAKDEKRAFTLFVTTTCAGDILPFQCVWAGKTAASLPSKDAPGMEKALGHGFCFTVAASEKSPRSHFSTLKTMKEYITDIIMPYVKSVIAADPDLNDEQKAALYIDVYPVHTSKPFRTFIYNGFPNLVIVFVPANCTGKYQPADVGIQRPLKHKLKTALFEWMVGVHREQLAAGAKSEEIKVTTSLPKLRDASVAGLVKAYEYMQSLDGRDLIKKV
ncbi:DDE superfamily partial [Lentinula edodes]|uniref:DDE superfamily partial n=1 Tax=Lentinula edodes TaxID=5353 RepID=A0A1Q3ETL8_LENED|nr:DDE superfamily partial [Lentinula edodes]